jgi:hypothetical protein
MPMPGTCREPPSGPCSFADGRGGTPGGQKGLFPAGAIYPRKIFVISGEGPIATDPFATS